MSEVKALTIPVPEIPIQKDVCDRIATVQKLGDSFGGSRYFLDALFSSLQHRAFRGEL